MKRDETREKAAEGTREEEGQGMAPGKGKRLEIERRVNSKMRFFGSEAGTGGTTW